MDFYTITRMMANTDGEGSIFIFALLFAGFVFYGAMYYKYRNKGARHKHEAETNALIENVTGSDMKVQSMTRLSNARMIGANNTRVKGALNQSGKQFGGVVERVVPRSAQSGINKLMGQK